MFVKDVMEGLLFGSKKEKEPEVPVPPPADVAEEGNTFAQGIENFVKTPGRLRGAPGAAPTGYKKNLGME